MEDDDALLTEERTRIGGGWRVGLMALEGLGSGWQSIVTAGNGSICFEGQDPLSQESSHRACLQKAPLGYIVTTSFDSHVTLYVSQSTIYNQSKLMILAFETCVSRGLVKSGVT